MTTTKTKPEAFEDVPVPDEERHHEVLAIRTNERGYKIAAIRMRYYDNLLEFAEVDFPDGTTAYFTQNTDPDVPGELRAGPFGGGYSWACPKYVVEAAGRLLRETFPPDTTEVPDAE